jgi:hypothetical protein
MNGLKTSWELIKIIVPVYFFVTFLKHTPALNYISKLISPFMELLGLSGESSIVLVMGYALNLYAALGAIASLTLSLKEITILAIMLSFAHSFFIETAVSKKFGISTSALTFLRFVSSIIAGFIANLLL